jgi:D-proline reductase (dithiol) PrdB
VGLIQREIEKAGISTIGISIVQRFSEKIKPPRTVFLPFSFGHPLGSPFDVKQQDYILKSALSALYSIKKAGEIIDLPVEWDKKDKHGLYDNDVRIRMNEPIEGGT